VKTRQRQLLAALLAVCLLAVTACGGQTNGSSGSSSKTTVTLWSWTPISATTQQIVTAFEQKYPNIQIKATIEPHPDYNTALKAAAASGSLPDIVGLPAGSQTQEYRADLQPLNTIAQQFWGSSWQSDFPHVAITQARLGNPAADSNFYMLPQETEVITPWYNKAIFSQLHLTPPQTFSELISDAHKISAAGYIPFFQGAEQTNFDTWMFMQLAAQTDLTGMEAAAVGKPTWTDPGMIQAATAWQTLFTQKVFQPGTLGDTQYPTGANLFAAGRVGMILLGSWWLQETQVAGVPSGLSTMSDYATFSFPPLTAGGQPTPDLGGIDFGWGLTKNANSSSAVEAASEKVLKYLISGGGEQIAVNAFNDLPAFKGFQPTTQTTSNVKTLYTQFLQEVQQAHNHLIGNPTIEQALDANLQAIGAGTESPAQAMAKVQQVASSQ
jgi:raffinose/stachyose/melibiose transport system substrate-binding protein